MNLRRCLLFPALLFSFSAGSWAAEHSSPTPQPHAISVTQAWARALPANAPAAAVYLHIQNHSEHADQLIKVSTDIAQSSELHQTIEHDGLMKMEHVDQLELPPHTELALTPGGKHIMLFGLKRPLIAGEHFSLTLDFAHAGKQQVNVDILQQAPATASEAHPHHH